VLVLNSVNAKWHLLVTNLFDILLSNAVTFKLFFCFEATVLIIGGGQKRQTDTYILILICEMGSSGLVDCHDDGYYVLAVHNGCGQDIARCVFSKFVNKCAEVTILQ